MTGPIRAPTHTHTNSLRAMALDLAWNCSGAALALYPILLILGHSKQLFLASIGGSTLFVFLLADAPAAQPRAVVGGHLVGALIGAACLVLLGSGNTSMMVATILAMATMRITRTIHPPAGANPLIVIHAGVHGGTLLSPILLPLLLVVAGFLWSRFRPGTGYPRSWWQPSPAHAADRILQP